MHKLLKMPKTHNNFTTLTKINQEIKIFRNVYTDYMHVYLLSYCTLY